MIFEIYKKECQTEMRLREESVYACRFPFAVRKKTDICQYASIFYVSLIVLL